MRELKKIKKELKIKCPNCAEDLSENFILLAFAKIRRSKGKERPPITSDEARRMANIRWGNTTEEEK